MRKHMRMLGIVWMVVWSLSVATVSYSQDASLIYACVDQQGRPRFVAPETSCGARETLLTWPATLTGGVSYYQKSAAASLVNTPMTVVALCDAPEDTATGGGYRWEPNPGVSPPHSSCWVQASASCRASGVCGGPAGEDGWAVIAWSCTATSQPSVMHVYVTCSQP